MNGECKEGDEMQMRNAAPLAYTRRKYIGFPESLLIEPEDFSEKTAKKFLGYAKDAMDSSAALRSGRQYVRAVIAEDGFVVLGIMTYLRNMAEDGWEGKDRENRPIYGFFGYVWHKEDFTAKAGFPALEEFAPILDQWIRPNWEAAHRSEAPRGEYGFAVTLPEARPLQGYAPGKRFVEPDEADRLIQWAMEKACAGETVSVCTCADIYAEADYRTQYQYAAKLRRTGGREIQPAETRKTMPERPKEQTPPSREREQRAREYAPEKTAGGGQEQTPGLAKWGAFCCVLAVVLCLLGRIIFHSVLPGLLLLLIGLGILAASRRKPEKGQARPMPMEPERQEPALRRPPLQPPKTPQAGDGKSAKKKESTEDIFKL